MSVFLQKTITNGIKSLVRLGLWCYFKEIHIQGFSKECHSASVIYMANHQNALLDALLIAAHTHRKTTFITRSDVFKNPFIGAFLRYIGMLPIYRFRDGVDTLKKNKPIFERCGNILDQGEAILIFPEGNHGYKRKLRPLKKGFLQLLSQRWNLGEAPVFIAPMGLNYEDLTQFPDRVSVIFGSPLLCEKESVETEVSEVLIDRVANALRELTTHIPLDSEADYKRCLQFLHAQNANFLDPVATREFIHEFMSQYPNKALHSDNSNNTKDTYFEEKLSRSSAKSRRSIFVLFFHIVNALPIFIWRKYMRPAIVQKEFISTFRFAFCMVFYPLFYLFLAIGIWLLTKNIGAAVAAPMIFFSFNLLSVKKLL